MIDSPAASRQKSCNACVRGKRRCDKRSPRCSRCVSRGLDCGYYQRMPTAGFVDDYDEGRVETTGATMTGLVDLDLDLDLSLLDEDAIGSGWQLFVDKTTTAPPPPPLPPPPPPPPPLPGRHLSVLRSSEQMCREFDPMQVHDARSRVGFVVAFLTSLPGRLARDSALPFMHPRLWASSLPRPLLAVFSAAAAHSTKSSHNRAWTARLIADACRDVLREGTNMPNMTNTTTTTTTTSSSTTSGDDDDDDDDDQEKHILARVQALTIANAIRVFDGDVALGAAAEREMAILVAWLKDLVSLRDMLEERAGNAGGRPLRHLSPESWESWIFLESVRRTIVTTSAFMTIVYLLKSEQPTPGMWIERQCFTASKHLWEAGSSVDFYRAWREKPHYWVENLAFGDLWMYARPTDLDEFTRLMLTPYVGVDAMDHFMEGDVLMPR